MNTKITLYFNGKLVKSKKCVSNDSGMRYDNMHDRWFQMYDPHVDAFYSRDYIRYRVSFIVPFSIDKVKEKTIIDFKNRSYWPSLHANWIKISNFTNEFKKWCRESFKDIELKSTDMEVSLIKTKEAPKEKIDVELVRYQYMYDDREKMEPIAKKAETEMREIASNINTPNFNF